MRSVVSIGYHRVCPLLYFFCRCRNEINRVVLA